MRTHKQRITQMEKIEVELSKILGEVKDLERDKKWKPGQKSEVYDKSRDVYSELNSILFWVG